VLDIRLIRREPDAVRGALARRGDAAAAAIEQVMELDKRWRGLTAEAEEVRAELNRASRGRKTAPTPEEREELGRLSARGRELSDDVAAVLTQRDAELSSLPNLPAPDVPDSDEVLREVGEAGRTGLDHLELAGERIDMARAARVSGSRFAYLRGDVALLEVALVGYAMRKLLGEGFEPVIPPVLVRERAMFGTGMLPDTEQQIYQVAEDELYLVGTSEVSLASMHEDEILPADTLPRRYAGFSTCFRREAGAAGKDTRGIFRVHQFDKVEMFCFVEPGQGRPEHERLLAIQESILQQLGIPYRVVAIAVNDLGASAAKKYDCEAWLPGQGRYRELTSCSNTTDYQARRLDIRFRPHDERSREGARAVVRPAHLHTLNGTAVAVGRTIIALLENGQQGDGSVLLPDVLRSFGAPEMLAPAE
jgi:seryl-tRNA synthetase